MSSSYLEAYAKAATEQNQLEILKEAGRHLDQALKDASPSARGAVQNLRDNAPKLWVTPLEDKVYYDIPLQLLENEVARNIILKWCDAEGFLPTERNGRSALDGE